MSKIPIKLQKKLGEIREYLQIRTYTFGLVIFQCLISIIVIFSFLNNMHYAIYILCGMASIYTNKEHGKAHKKLREMINSWNIK